ncbi:serine carboxypeptidase-like 18 [Tasmannia lanceolata]|uniref:serine carboxypeptidase-like 18 n=1 Tax=Tasmannia lanceolata TaxID=3420 RepID=UPI0040630640
MATNLTPSKNMCSIYLVLLLILLLSSPWPVISRTRVQFLPGFDGPLPFQLETGYISVGDSDHGQLFYYFIESENNPKEDPLLLWLTGGQGCSALSAVIYEIGPLYFKNVEYNGSLPTLILKPHSWTKAVSIIFPDQPIGAGFSYSRGSNDYQTGDIITSEEIHEFLLKWLLDHPQFISNPLYIGGDSYGGKIAPIVAQQISNDIEKRMDPLLNLKGYIVGNPRVDEKKDDSAVVPFAHGMGLISDELYESAKRSCKGKYVDPTNPHCAKDLETINECLAGIDEGYIVGRKCPDATNRPNEMVGDRRSLEDRFNELPQPLPDFGCRFYAYLFSYYWANDSGVRKALNIQKGSIGEWQRCNRKILYTQDIASSLEYHLNLTTKGYRALVYSGDHDMLVPFVGTQEWIRSLNFSIVDDWRPWLVDGQVAGYTRTYANSLTFATVKGAAHVASESNPKECFDMFQRWISHSSL